MGAKLQELEDDMASNAGTAERTLSALKVVRDFCLEEKGYTYFLVNFRDKEQTPAEYNLLTDLMDVRLVHLLDAGVSDPHAAGQRSEAFLLDLSQCSGSRLRAANPGVGLFERARSLGRLGPPHHPRSGTLPFKSSPFCVAHPRSHCRCYQRS